MHRIDTWGKTLAPHILQVLHALSRLSLDPISDSKTENSRRNAMSKRIYTFTKPPKNAVVSLKVILYDKLRSRLLLGYLVTASFSLLRWVGLSPVVRRLPTDSYGF